MILPIFRVDNLSHRFETVPVLDGVSFSIESTARVGIVGPNGAGKTTLLKILARVLRGWKGTLLFRDRPFDEWNLRAFAREVAYLPQHTAVSFPYSVREVVLMGRLPFQEGRFFDNREDQAAVEEAMEMAQCSHLAGRRFLELSGGEQQLVSLASALAQRPKVLLLDEPTVFLDLKHQLQICRILRRLHAECGTSLLLASHDLNFVSEFCDRILMLKAGRLVGDLLGSGERLIIPTSLLEEVFEVEAREVDRGQGSRIEVRYGD